MLEIGVDIEEFRLFVVAFFPPGDCIPQPPTNLTKVFEAITHHGLWDSLHYSPLVWIVRNFGASDPEMKAWIENYKKDLKAYTIVASIEDCIDSDLDACADQSKVGMTLATTVLWNGKQILSATLYNISQMCGKCSLFSI